MVTGGSVEDSLDRLRRVKAAVRGAPVYVGGGATAGNVAQFFEACDGVIVGNAVKVGPEFQGEVDRDRLAAFMEAADRARR